MSPRVLGIKIPKKKRRTSKSQHLAYTGEEPDWVVFMQSNPNKEAIYRERTRSYDWYNYYHKSSSLLRDVEKWLPSIRMLLKKMQTSIHPKTGKCRPVLKRSFYEIL